MFNMELPGAELGVTHQAGVLFTGAGPGCSGYSVQWWRGRSRLVRAITTVYRGGEVRGHADF